jgi:hypothetical protein
MNETANNNSGRDKMKGNHYIMTSSGTGTGATVPTFGPMSFKRAMEIISMYPKSGYTMAARMDVEREHGANPIIKAKRPMFFE